MQFLHKITTLKCLLIYAKTGSLRKIAYLFLKSNEIAYNRVWQFEMSITNKIKNVDMMSRKKFSTERKNVHAGVEPNMLAYKAGAR